jgi:nucleoside-diphosphate-sugar epimerase
MAASLDVLIIGGSGFVSGTTAREAVAQGHRVTVITRGQRALPEGVTGLVADRKDRAAMASVVESAEKRWDLVVDCIGYEPADAAQDVALFADRAAHFVFVSTDFVYDPAFRTFPQTEENDHYLGPGNYGGDKRLCELEFINGATGQMRWTIFRPCHIYGPGSEIGCLPTVMRDPELLPKMERGETLALVGNGHLLQQPIFVEDLARMMLSCAGNEQAAGEIFIAYGPDIVESRGYYQIIAELLGVELHTSELPITQYLAEAPQPQAGMCHRICSLDKMRAKDLCVPSTGIREGLRRHVAWKLGVLAGG